MNENALVFRCADISVEDVIEHAIKNPLNLGASDVDVVEAARAQEGEVWSPQLLPYRPWTEGDAGEGAAGAADDLASVRGGTDGDLFVVGALGMGITDEEREELLAQAARFAVGGEGAAAGGAVGAGRIDAGLRDAVKVRQDADGYALVGFDLRRFAEAADAGEDAAVVLPAFVDGVPVVRIAAEAFSRRFVQGVGVRVLVIPDTVRSVAANAFLAVSARRIHVGRSVELLGEQRCDLAGVSPRLARREYSVDARNKRYLARDGSLYADGGRELLFLASPYGERVVLPADAERVAAAAFAEGCEPPSVVDCGGALARVEARNWDDAVWRCPEEAPAHRALAKRGVRLAGPDAVELDGCWYDFDDEGAVLVAGPPQPVSVSRRFAEQAAVRAVAVRKAGGDADAADGAPSPFAAAAEAATEFAAAGYAGSTVEGVSVGESEVLALPREVEGRPLVRIGVRALPWAPPSVIVPDTVRVIERDNACRATKRLVLSEGLEAIGAHCFWSRKLDGPVVVPASVRSVGEGCFEYAVCRLARVGAVVHVSANQLSSCWLADAADGVPFDFARYDEMLRQGESLPDGLGALLHRLAVPYRLDEETRAALVRALRSQGRPALERVAREGDVAMVRALVEAGFIDDEVFERQIELLRACNRTDCVAYLMELHREQREAANAGAAGGAKSLRDRFAL
ncbi:MAG TPA: leucine-rich repeat domain-containing protein [Candidatus Rubneribacter avistercoris]|nr:leucine-rich repeat domain-containing protein [Candidatus Rubneribacter avistercoris]